MLTPPTAPSPGKPVSAGFFSRLIAWVKSGMLIEGPGYRLKRGPNGTALVLQQSTKANAPIATGCFAIEKINIENKTVKLINCYYQIGGHTYNDDEEGLWSEQCSVEDELAYLCVVLPAGTSRQGGIYLTWYDWSSLGQEQANPSKYVIPLYAFSREQKKDGATDVDTTGDSGQEEYKFMFSLVCDMRNAPRAQMLEFN